ncbi:sodium:proton antiporter [Herbiconiux moechotypicola]|uniref:Na+/H+ antiporter n=1 Tax=Herbiconiux moechotypicola TaxID=637393 RepID=A0ABP5QCE3_9MICO|nr:sodium:proton antiporter [Herbiconiux moechotypicola]MCS5729697.1 sodium:proton antiporter [Herbiconiux moechotypicola]
MEAAAIGTIVWVVSFVVVTVAVTGLSGRIGWSAPIVLVVVGAVVSFIPGVPAVEVEPDLILYGLLPPLLFAAAIRTSFADVRARRDGILLLSVGLVAFTVVAVGLTAWLVVPAITLAAAFAFGAVVAPTDAVAVTAIAGRLKLPRRLVTVLEGESLLNDATALVALNAAIAAIVAASTGTSATGDAAAEPLSPWLILLEFVIAVVVGVGFGFVVGGILAAVRKRLHSPVLDTSLSLITPYVAFIPAQLLHGSGVLAVVVAGLFLGLRAPVIQTAQARIAEALNWRTIQFLLENAVFLFIGLSLPAILEGALATGPGVWPTIWISAAILLSVFLSRFVWMMFTTSVYRFGPQWLRPRGWSWRNGIAVSVAGIRGVVTLAAVFLLPEETPGRAFLQFLAFVVVVGTLLGGAFLPFVIRRLHLPPPDFRQEQSEVHMLLAEAQTHGLARLDEELDEGVDRRVVERLRLNAGFLGDALENPGEGDEPLTKTYNRLRRSMIAAERDAVLAARSEGRYQERAVKAVLAKIDVEETELDVGRSRGDE